MNAIKDLTVGALIGSMLGTAIFMATPAAPLAAQPLVCTEDMGCWDAETMGNGNVGPDWDCETMGNGICELGKPYPAR